MKEGYGERFPRAPPLLKICLLHLGSSRPHSCSLVIHFIYATLFSQQSQSNTAVSDAVLSTETNEPTPPRPGLSEPGGAEPLWLSRDLACPPGHLSEPCLLAKTGNHRYMIMCNSEPGDSGLEQAEEGREIREE